LMGITPLANYQMTSTVQLIATCIKAEAMSRGVSLQKGLGLMNAYLEAIKDNDVSKVAFTALAYPAAPAKIVLLEKSENAGTAAYAQLYDGQYEAATATASKLGIVAADEGSLMQSLQLSGHALNGKAGLPTAANALLEEKEPKQK